MSTRRSATCGLWLYCQCCGFACVTTNSRSARQPTAAWRKFFAERWLTLTGRNYLSNLLTNVLSRLSFHRHLSGVIPRDSSAQPCDAWLLPSSAGARDLRGSPVERSNSPGKRIHELTKIRMGHRAIDVPISLRLIAAYIVRA